MSNDRKYVVLVADDEPSTVALLGRHLRSRGYTVLEAQDGEEALQLVRRHAGHIDLVITDVVMARLGGLELARRVAGE